MSAEGEISRRRWLKIAGGTVVGLGAAAAAGYFVYDLYFKPKPKKPVNFLCGNWATVYGQNAAKEYEEKTGKKVIVTPVAWAELWPKISTSCMAATSAYDVMEFDMGWTSKAVAEKWIVPLEDIFTSEELASFDQTYLKADFLNGHNYGVPWDGAVSIFLYNKKMLTDAGFDHPPATWDELREQSLVIKEKGLCEYPLYSQLVKGNAHRCFQHHLISRGGAIVDENNNLTINSTVGVEALQWLTDAYNEWKILSPVSFEQGIHEAIDIFAGGACAFFTEGMQQFYVIATNPELSKIAGDAKIGLYPGGKKGQSAADLGIACAVIAANSEVIDDARAWVKFACSAEQDKEIVLTSGLAPMHPKNYEDPDIKKKYPHFEYIKEQNKYAFAPPNVPWWPEFTDFESDKLQAAVLKKMTVKEALDACVAQWNELKARG